MQKFGAKTSNFFAKVNFLYHKYFFLEPKHVKISRVTVHGVISTRVVGHFLTGLVGPCYLNGQK